MNDNPIERYEKLKFSKRELEILTWSAKGKTLAEIAIILSIKATTAKEHFERCQRKLNTANKTHTIAVAVALGIIDIFQQASPLNGGLVDTR